MAALPKIARLPVTEIRPHPIGCAKTARKQPEKACQAGSPRGQTGICAKMSQGSGNRTGTDTKKAAPGEDAASAVTALVQLDQVSRMRMSYLRILSNSVVLAIIIASAVREILPLLRFSSS